MSKLVEMIFVPNEGPDGRGIAFEGFVEMAKYIEENPAHFTDLQAEGIEIIAQGLNGGLYFTHRTTAWVEFRSADCVKNECECAVDSAKEGNQNRPANWHNDQLAQFEVRLIDVWM